MNLKLLIISPLFLFSCAGSVKENSGYEIEHHSYDDVNRKTVVWSDVFRIELEKYYVYFYSKVCHFCEEMRDEVITIALRSDESIYFCSGNEIVMDENLLPEGTIGINDILDFKIKGFPSLVEVNNHAIYAHMAGKKDTLNFLRKLV